MKKSELKALILECKYELAEESKLNIKTHTALNEVEELLEQAVSKLSDMYEGEDGEEVRTYVDSGDDLIHDSLNNVRTALENISKIGNN